MPFRQRTRARGSPAPLGGLVHHLRERVADVLRRVAAVTVGGLYDEVSLLDRAAPEAS